MGIWTPNPRVSLAFVDELATSGTGNYTQAANGGGSANTKGSYVELKASLPYDIDGIFLTLQNAPNGYQVFDIAIGGSGSEVVVVPNWCGSRALSGGHADLWVWIPIHITAGTRVAIRSQSSAGSGYFHVKANFTGAGRYSSPQLWTAYTQIAGGPYGVLVTPGGGNSKGSYTAITTASDYTSAWISVAIMGATSPEDMAIDLAVGGAGVESIIFADMYYSIESLAEQSCFPFCIPGGTRIASRGQTNGGTTNYGLAVHIGA